MGVAPNTIDYFGTKHVWKGRNNREFDELIEKMSSILSGWKAKALSWASRTT